MKNNVLLSPILCCLVFCLLLTSCNRDAMIEDDVIKEELTFDHNELAKKMYSADFLAGKGEMVDGNFHLDVNITDALSAEEKAFLEKEGVLYIDKSFKIPYEDAIQIWGEDAPIPAEGISFSPGTYEHNDPYRGCWVCVQCSCGGVVCTYYDICIIIVVREL